ncbi:MAG: D-alanyl-D-alanine carboxypeptidase [Clostridiales bacterium]|nr:D-alanyl-D-alanine carboxypeptidase [Clostridiales bacterium]
MMPQRLICCFTVFVILFICTAIPAAALTPSELKEKLISETAVLMDGETGQVLFEKDHQLKMAPASITKIMTALLALENSEPGSIISMSEEAVFSIGRGTSHIALDVDEELTLEDALYALAIESANDAANGIAEHISGSLAEFAALMNYRAQKAGAINTNFSNAHGLPDPDHYTTAYDMAMITRAALEIPRFTEIFSAFQYDMPPTNKQEEPRIFWRNNSLLTGKYKYQGVIATKTGWTRDSQHTLVTAAKRDGRTLIAVVMKSSAPNDKWEDTVSLLDYGFSELISVNFTKEELAKEHYLITDGYGTEIDAELFTDKNFSCLIPNSMTKADIKIHYITENNISPVNPQVKAVFLLDTENPGSVFSKLGELEMTMLDNNYIATSADLTSNNLTDDKKWPSIVIWTIGILGILLVLFIFLGIRREIMIQRRWRNRYNSYIDRNKY